MRRCWLYSFLFSTVLLSQLLQKQCVVADVYMNHPRGSNNKMTEQSNNAQNQNRLFDSQNNAAAGYQIGDNCVPNCLNINRRRRRNDYQATAKGAQEGQMYYYHGSKLYVEWTAQHGCGGSPGDSDKNTECQIILQYMCASFARDGRATETPLRDGKDPDSNSRRRRGGGNNANPQGANAEAADDLSRGRHESFMYYNHCRKRQRNKGLYTAGRNLNNNNGAAATRQNNGGTRRGLECPEERDYYPYWHPSEWKDIVVFTSESGQRCKYYREESQNVKPKGWCDHPKLKLENVDPTTLNQNDQVPNNPADCAQDNGVWMEHPGWLDDPPECLAMPHNRDNHHGSIDTGLPMSYMWEIPEHILDNDTCVLRLRYNMTSGDLLKPPDEASEKQEPPWDYFLDLDSRYNGADRRPLGNDPKKDFIGFGWNASGPLQVQVNTAQFGRTFQDRSHTFKVRKRPDYLRDDDEIINYNVRGRRGNIVQVYPAVEYDFVPPDLEVSQGSFLHFQWTGSDANSNGNAGNGKQATDRSNLVQIQDRSTNKPVSGDKHTLFYDAQGPELATEAKNCHPSVLVSCGRSRAEGQALVNKFAFLDQHAHAIKAGNACPGTPEQVAQKNDQDNDNCHQLNAAPAYFDGGLVQMRNVGTHHIASTRNNDYSNRSQKATIKVTRKRVLAWEVALLVGVPLLAAAAAWQFATAAYAFSNPTSNAFSHYNRPALLKMPCLRKAVARKEEERRRYKKTLQDAWRAYCAELDGKGSSANGKNGSKDDSSSNAPSLEGFLQASQDNAVASAAVAAPEATTVGAKDALPPPPASAIAPTAGGAASASPANGLNGGLKSPRPGGGPKSGSPDLTLPPEWVDIKKAGGGGVCATLCGSQHRWRQARGGCCACFRKRNLFTIGFVSANLFIGLAGALRNLGGGYNAWYPVAKCGGYLLDFNLSVILIPTLRTLHAGARQVHALDGLFNEDPIRFHIQVAGCVFISTCIHVVGHVNHIIAITDGVVFVPAMTKKQQLSGRSAIELLFDPANRFAGFTGVLILYLMGVMFVTAPAFIRRRTFDLGKFPRTFKDFVALVLLFGVGLFYLPLWLPAMCWTRLARRFRRDPSTPCSKKFGGFIIFWEAHRCWKPVFFLLLMHGPQCWIWFLWPLILVLCDRLVRWERREVRVLLRSAELMTGKVMKLTFTPPPGFVYQAGMYAQLNCDVVNGEEWHPFTLTSAPEEAHLSMHIRCPDDLDWCSALRRKLVENPAQMLSKETLGQAIKRSRIRVHYAPYVSEGTCALNSSTCARPWRVEVFDQAGAVETSFQIDPKARQKEDEAKLWPARSVTVDPGDAAEEEEGGVKVALQRGRSDISLADLVRPRRPADVVQLGLDGPHGAPSELVWQHRVVVLVGAGIGVTPFASILRSITLRVPSVAEIMGGAAANTSGQTGRVPVFSKLRRVAKAQKESEDARRPSIEAQDESPAEHLPEWRPCEHVHFYWLCRSQDEFEWFYDLLRDAVADSKGNQSIEVNLFQTGEIELTKVKALGCGFRQFFGRPNWSRIFQGAAKDYPGENVGVFFCGPPPVRDELRRQTVNATKSSQEGTRFVLHAENF